MVNPEAYTLGLLNLCFGKYQFWRWMAYGIFTAMIVNFFTFYTIEGPRSSDPYGNLSSLWVTGI